jgi:predicted enzyme related to lactoylglutathione lyase
MNPFTQPGAFSWCELLTSDVEGAKAFYGEVFGWTLKEGPLGNIPYTVIEVDGHEIGGIAPLPPGNPHMPPTWGSYITVQDVDQTVQKVTELGGAVVMQPMDIPTVGRFALIKDPQGAMIAVIAYAAMPPS